MKGPNGEDLPDAMLLLACTFNAVRSPMAAAIMRHLYGKARLRRLRRGEGPENSIRWPSRRCRRSASTSGLQTKTFAQLDDSSFDLIVFVAGGPSKALGVHQVMAVEAEYWPTRDPTAHEGSRSSGSTPTAPSGTD